MSGQWPNGSGMVMPRWLAHVALWVFLAVGGLAVGASGWAIVTMWDVGVFVGEARTTMGDNKAGVEAAMGMSIANGKAIAKLEGRHAEGP